MLKKLKIGPRLVLYFVIAVLIASISGVAGIIILGSTDRSYSDTLDSTAATQAAIGQFNANLNKGAALVRDIVLLTDVTEIKKAQSDLEAATALVDESLVLIKEYCTTEAEKAHIQTIDQGLNSYRNVRGQVIELGLRNQNDEALTLLRGQALPGLEKAIAAAEELNTVSTKLSSDLSNQLTQNAGTTSLIMGAVMVAAALVSVLFAVVVARGISKPIIAVQTAAGQLEHGDLNIHVDSDSGDEIGMMTRSFGAAATQLRAYIDEIAEKLGQVAGGNFNIRIDQEFRGDFKQIQESIESIVDALSSTLAEISTASSQVTAGAEQVSSGAQALAQGATEQASAVEELSATITEIADGARKNAGAARDCREQSLQAGAQVDVCSDYMKEMVSAMSDITDSSQEIAKIIATIENIAFQTNILALNAAVEAARAGTAGKGFAVVADEVRNLASKSDQAAKATKELIEGSVNAVRHGSTIVGSVSEALQKTVELARAAVNGMGAIASAVDAEAQSISQVTEGIDQISSVVQTNSATSEESAAASEELSAQAQVLKRLVGQFQLKEQVGWGGSQSALSGSGSRSSHQQHEMRGSAPARLPSAGHSASPAFDKY